MHNVSKRDREKEKNRDEPRNKIKYNFVETNMVLMK